MEEQKTTEKAAGAMDAVKATCQANVCKNKKTILGVIILLLIVGYSIYAQKSNNMSLDSLFTKGISKEEAKAKIEKLIGEDSSGVAVKDVVEESGLFKVTIGIEGQPDQYAYVTKDGAKFIQQALDFAEIEKQEEAQKKAEEEANKPVEKNDKPVVDLYVMSFCPYGNKAEDTMKSVYDLLKNKVTFNFRYIVNTSGNEVQSLHGAPEVAQNEREACVMRDYGKDKWFAFVTYVNKNCGGDGACWETGAKSLAINTAKVSACATADGVALMKEDEKSSNAAGATGSPTMKINGASSKAVYQYGNSDAYKEAICAAFNTAPAECAKKLTSSAETSSAAAQGGSCGS